MAESGLNTDDGGELDLGAALLEFNSTWALIEHLEACLKEGDPDPILVEEKRHIEMHILPQVQERVYASM